jgi:crotonobetainyl-CoA:carnitine CoA-transferase CaiB-like acyl-CoA transferase
VPDSSAVGTHRADFLAGLRVLELGDGVAGSAAASLLWALGADVTAVIDPASAHRRGRPHVDRGGRPVSLLSIILDRGKRLASVTDRTELEGLLSHGDADGRTFDLVVVDRVGGSHGPLASLHDIDAYAAFVRRRNPRAWLTISAFGLTGDRAADVATELTVAAAGGMLASVRDQRTGLPLKLAGMQSLLNTGQAGALAACHAVGLAADEGTVHLDLSAVEATIAMGPILELGGLLLNTGSVGGAKRYGAPASFYECSDGMIRISAMEDHQWRGVVEAMGSPAWAARFATVAARIEAAGDIDEHVAAWARTLAKAEAERLLQSHGVPATAMYSPAEILDSPQLAYRAAFEPVQAGNGRRARVAGLPFLVADGGNASPRAGERRRRSLRGLRILEASHVLAAPLAGAILGALGAEVTKLEDLRRMDMYRRRGPYIDGEAGIERSAYFALVNHSKRSAAFDVDTARARLEALLDRSDVVLENLGGKRASALGLAASSVLAKHPDLLALSSSGFGQDGPYAAYRAYAYNLHASSALGYLTRNAQDEPAEIDLAWADLSSAYALATLVAAWAVGPSGNSGAGLDFAMADLIVAHFNEFIAAASLDPGSDQCVDRANELSPHAPHGVYPATDGWLALSVDGDEQFACLATVLAHEPLSDPALARAGERFEQRHILDGRVAEVTRTQTARELAVALRAVGIAAEQVMTPADLLMSSQLTSRGFFTAVKHPQWGQRRLVGIPWRPFGGPPIALGVPPTLTPLEEEHDQP